MSTIFCYGNGFLVIVLFLYKVESACGEGHLLTKLNKRIQFPLRQQIISPKTTSLRIIFFVLF